MTTKFGLLRNKMKCDLETQSKALQAVAKLHNFIINNDGVPTRHQQPAVLDRNNQLTPAELAANGIVPLPDGMGPNGFITVVDYNKEDRPVVEMPLLLIFEMPLLLIFPAKKIFGRILPHHSTVIRCSCFE